MKNKHKQLMERNFWSSLTAFNNMIIDGDITTRGQINKWFKDLVVKGDYSGSAHDELLEYSYSLL